MEKIYDEIQHKNQSIAKIMAELELALENMEKVERTVAILGSARATIHDKYYQDAEKIAKLLVENNYGVITGGGPGIMEAGNKGAFEANGQSTGLHILLPHEQKANAYINNYCEFNYFFLRKLIFEKYSLAYVIMPGGIGTLDEFFEALVLAQTQKIVSFPIILYGSEFWSGLIDWLKIQVIARAYLDFADLDRLVICDSPEEALQAIKKFVI